MNRLDRFLSAFGVILCVGGWAGLIGGSLVETGTLAFAGRSLSQRDVMTLSQSVLVTGTMLIFLASMRSGFGALDRFFDAALDRANRKTRSDMIEPPPEPHALGATTRRMRLDGRHCIRLADGSVLVETVLGARRFASEAEARAFLGLLPETGEAPLQRATA